MHRWLVPLAFCLPSILWLSACSESNSASLEGESVEDSGAASQVDSRVDGRLDIRDSGVDGPAATRDAETGTECHSGAGAPGQCLAAGACTSMSKHTASSTTCNQTGTLICCIKTPSTADNPPIPAGYKLMAQSQVTTAMTTWAVEILHDPATYPLFATQVRLFGALSVLARVEWHPPDFQNGAIHRGVTLYVPK